MKVSLLETAGLEPAVLSIFVSKRHLDTTLALNIHKEYLDYIHHENTRDAQVFERRLTRALAIGRQHTTVLRFINFSFLVEDIHRGAQDDWDSHARRFDNRIIRSSTRLSASEVGAKSDYYDGKIMTFGEAIKKADIPMPIGLTIDGVNYEKTDHGYIREDLAENQDVVRGLYPLCLPSTFVYSVNLAEFCHIYKVRRAGHGAHEEVSQLAETCALLIKDAIPQVDQTYLLEVET